LAFKAFAVIIGIVLLYNKTTREEVERGGEGVECLDLI